MEEETMEVVDSEVVAMTDSPSEPTQPTEVAPAEPVEPALPTEPVAEPEPQLFELPDGRKVDADTLAKEWKQNFYPEYTRKSQALAEKEKANITNEPKENPFSNPEYVPQSYEEIIKAAEERALQALEERQKQAIEQQQAVETEVANQLTKIKEIDPGLNENALFLHANKYGFRDLTVAYQNMKDMNQLVKNTQQMTIKNVQKRADPVSSTQGQTTGVKPDPSAFENAREYLRSIR